MQLRPDDYQRVLQDLHVHLCAEGRFPAGDQTLLIKEFFQKKKMIILAQCGRDAGKTEDVLYICWRYGLTFPGSEIYVICPEIKQGKRIYWNSNRLPRYGPEKYARDKLKSELRLILQVPGYPPSVIAVDGCENYDSLRGIKPDLVVYDEVQLHTKHFNEEVMQPNFSRGSTALVAVGTPPKRYCHYVDFRQEIVDKAQQGHEKYSYIELPTWSNPLSDRRWLAEKRADLFKKGKQNVWYREYEGKMIFDSESAILPFWDRRRHSVTKSFLKKRIEKDRKKLEWYAIFDPGTATCFAGLFIAVNPYKSEVYVLDVIYETRRGMATALKIWARSNKIKAEWNPDIEDWRNIYDSAAAWFPNEVLADYDRRGEDIDFGFFPTNKTTLRVKPDEGRAGESVLNALMEAIADDPEDPEKWGQLFFVREDLEPFFKEIESYVTDEAGRYPTSYDHLIDCLFYWVVNSGYAVAHMTDWDALRREKEEKYNRVETFESMAEKHMREKDWSRGLEDVGLYDFDEYGEGELWH